LLDPRVARSLLPPLFCVPSTPESVFDEQVTGLKKKCEVVVIISQFHRIDESSPFGFFSRQAFHLSSPPKGLSATVHFFWSSLFLGHQQAETHKSTGRVLGFGTPFLARGADQFPGTLSVGRTIVFCLTRILALLPGETGHSGFSRFASVHREIDNGKVPAIMTGLGGGPGLLHSQPFLQPNPFDRGSPFVRNFLPPKPMSAVGAKLFRYVCFGFRSHHRLSVHNRPRYPPSSTFR